jgi:F1F0 ATPase subunit 2
VGAWLVVGALIGASYFLALRWNARMFVTGKSLPAVSIIQLARFAALAVLLSLIASHFGALPLLASTVGIQTARTAVLRFGGVS